MLFSDDPRDWAENPEQVSRLDPPTESADGVARIERVEEEIRRRLSGYPGGPDGADAAEPKFRNWLQPDQEQSALHPESDIKKDAIRIVASPDRGRPPLAVDEASAAPIAAEHSLASADTADTWLRDRFEQLGDGTFKALMTTAIWHAVDAMLFPTAGTVLRGLCMAISIVKQLDNTDGVKVGVPVTFNDVPLTFGVFTEFRDGASRRTAAPLGIDVQFGAHGGPVGRPSVELLPPEEAADVVRNADVRPSWRQELVPGADDGVAVVTTGRSPDIDYDPQQASGADVVRDAEAFAMRKTAGLKARQYVSDVIHVDPRNRRLRWFAQGRKGTWSEQIYSYDVREGPAAG